MLEWETPRRLALAAEAKCLLDCIEMVAGAQPSLYFHVFYFILHLPEVYSEGASRVKFALACAEGPKLFQQIAVKMCLTSTIHNLVNCLLTSSLRMAARLPTPLRSAAADSFFTLRVQSYCSMPHIIRASWRGSEDAAGSAMRMQLSAAGGEVPSSRPPVPPFLRLSSVGGSGCYLAVVQRGFGRLFWISPSFQI